MKMEAVEDTIVHLSSCENSDMIDVNTSVGSNSVELEKKHQIDDVTEQSDSKPLLTESVLDKVNLSINNDSLCDAIVESKDTSACLEPSMTDQAILHGKSAVTVETISETVVEDSAVITEIATTLDECTNNSEGSNVSTNLTSTDNVRFETEIFIEKVEIGSINGNSLGGIDKNENISDDNDSTNRILSQLEGNSIDLGEALRSGPSSCENNNGFVKQQEVLNKEELLNILEGNNTESTKNVNDQEHFDDHTISIESTIAVMQLQELKEKRGRKGNNRVSITQPQSGRKKTRKDIQKNKQNIVNVLVKDWEDDDIEEEGRRSRSKSLEQKEVLETSNTTMKDSPDNNKEEELDQSSVEPRSCNTSESAHYQSSDVNKNLDDTVLHRRAGRVIKKKIIFDPDNPDTFTKNKNPTKIKASQTDKSSSKRNKMDQILQRSESKSPVAKTLWKKPQPKNKNYNKRLTEVDKLLMDEGAVNMIYQLTPEASKGGKNMKTKAELIKKINQSSAPETKEKKFRERRKEAPKNEDTPEARKILGNKHRVSLNSSVNSPSVCEDFEAHSADDSIIYRRHSSSSYSSTCMSPRRLSDVDTNSVQSPRLSQVDTENSEKDNVSKSDISSGEPASDIFMSEKASVDSTEIIDKNVCLNLKEKLNSKLSRVLNMKRKREIKMDKPSKRKSSSKATTDDENEAVPEFGKLSVSFYDQVAEINIKQTGSKNNAYNVETLKELERALTFVNNRKYISITLLTSECGRLCAGVDFQPLLNDNTDKQSAFVIAESVRSVLKCLYQHSKVLVAGVAGDCEGLALAILLLCDYTVVSDQTMFTLFKKGSPFLPGMAVLTMPLHAVHQNLVQQMLLSGRRLSAAEAVQCGLVSRALWPHRFLQDLRAIVQDIAGEPTQTLLLKKRLLRLNMSAQAESTFLSSLETERDLLVEHWSSPTGLAALRNYTGSA